MLSLFDELDPPRAIAHTCATTITKTYQYDIHVHSSPRESCILQTLACERSGSPLRVIGRETCTSLFRQYSLVETQIHVGRYRGAAGGSVLQTPVFLHWPVLNLRG